jgi:hypothetical protein
LPEANPTTSAIKVLKAFSELDSSLFRAAIDRAYRFSFIGDNSFAHFSEYAQLPHSSFGVVHTIFDRACKEFILSNTKWATWEIVKVVANSLVGLGFILSSRGIKVPQPPTVIHASLDGSRWLDTKDAKELLPFVSLANSLANLPTDLFMYALETIKACSIYFRASVNAQDGVVLEDALESLKRFAVMSGSATVFLFLKSSEDVIAFNIELEETKRTIREISAEVAKYLVGEQLLVSKNTK